MDLFGNSLHTIKIKKSKVSFAVFSISGYTKLYSKTPYKQRTNQESCNKYSRKVIKFNFLLPLIYDIKKIFGAALGIEILCITSVEIGGSLALYVGELIPLRYYYLMRWDIA